MIRPEPLLACWRLSGRGRSREQFPDYERHTDDGYENRTDVIVEQIAYWRGVVCEPLLHEYVLLIVPGDADEQSYDDDKLCCHEGDDSPIDRDWLLDMNSLGRPLSPCSRVRDQERADSAEGYEDGW